MHLAGIYRVLTTRLPLKTRGNDVCILYTVELSAFMPNHSLRKHVMILQSDSLIVQSRRNQSP